MLLLLLLATQARPTAPWPPPEGPLRMVIDTDAANEVDDQYALSLALGFPERFKIEGVVAAHFGKGQKSLDASYEEARRVLKLAGVDVPLKKGALAFETPDRAPEAEGVDFIIERARAATPEDPLWLVLLGPMTNGAAALKKAPEIADRLIVFWHCRSKWPSECRNFNAKNDAIAARLAFELPCRFVSFDTGTKITLTVDESRRRYGARGPLGADLAAILERWLARVKKTEKGIYDLGDFAALIDPACVRAERLEAPGVSADLLYEPERKRGPFVRLFDVDRARSLELLEKALDRLKAAPSK
jgi:inosine-uridine nucleoside N-ribohydrolase